MYTVKRLRAYFSFYAKKFTKKILSSDICVKNRYYVGLIQRRSLDKARKYEGKYKDNFVAPKAIEIELTNRCDLRCVFCPNYSHKRKRGTMSFETFKNIVDGIKELGISQVVFSGFGECLLDRNIIEKLDYLHRHKRVAYVQLVTNGVLLTPELSKKICEGELVSLVNISIEAADTETYETIHNVDAFDKVVENVTLLYEIRKDKRVSSPHISVRFKDFSHNRGHFSNFVNKFCKISDNIRSYANIVEWPESNLAIGTVRRDKIIKIVCPNLWEGMRVNWNGDVVLCCQDYEGKVILGNVNDQSIVDIWNNKLIQYYRKNHKNFQFNELKICNDCDINSHLVVPW